MSFSPIRLAAVAAAFGLFAGSAVAADPIRWRTDYNAARKEATEKGLPLLVVVGTDDCFYCRKLDATTFKDAAVGGLLANGFVPLKIDANREPALARALKVTVYPSIVFAGSDGKIHGFVEGYLDADRMAEQLRRVTTTAGTADWAARDYNEASKAIAAGDYPRAVSLLKGVIREVGDKPVGGKAREVLDQVERQAAGRMNRARELEQRGLTPEAMDTLADLMKTYAGTQVATEAATLLAGLAEKPEGRDRLRGRAARDLLAAAKEDFRAERFYDCLQKCDQFAAAFADQPETRDIVTLAAEIKNNPDRLAAACEQMNDRTAAMYLVLAESWMKKGQDKEAIACLEKVAKLSPNSRHAEMAQSKLGQLRGTNPALPAGLRKEGP